MTRKLLTTTLLLGALLALGACSSDGDPLAPTAPTAEKARAGADGAPTLMSSDSRQGPKDRTSIVDVALAVNADSGEFSTLIAALQAAGLVEALDGRGQYTVFAPTDEAFAALGYDATSIAGIPVDDLAAILLYHVAPGERYAADVVASTRIRTLSKGFLFPRVEMGTAYVNDAEILATDIEADNGVIHVIGGVLLP